MAVESERLDTESEKPRIVYRSDVKSRVVASESERIGLRLKEVLASEFGITHTTIQFEHTHAPGDFHRYMPEPARPGGPSK